MRKRFLVKPRLQLAQLAWVLFVVAAASLSGYFFLESLIEQGLADGVIRSEEWVGLRFSLRWGFALVMLIIMIVMGIENYFFFHRIVGPLYALERALRRLAQGDFQDSIQIRDSDEFNDLIRGFQEVKKELQSRIELYDQTAQQLTHELDQLLKDTSPENIGQIQEKLKHIRDEVVKKAA